METNFESIFLEDNLLSDNDWESHHFPELSTENEMNWLAFGDSNSASHTKSNEVILDSGSDSGASLQIQPDNYYVENNGFNDMTNGFESPPLTPPDELKQQTQQNGDTYASIEELYAQLTRSHVNDACNNKDSVYRGKAATRCRSGSTSSAYSSKSSTPPPHFNQSESVFDGAFKQHGVKHPTNDEGFYEKTWEKSATKGIIQRRLPMPPQEETEFDRAVRDALKETNRLLSMHKKTPENPSQTTRDPSKAPTIHTHKDPINPPKPPAQPHKPPTIDLRQICDNVILNGQDHQPKPVQSEITNQALRPVMHEGALKRKSSDRNSRKFKKSTNCENQGNPLNQEPTIATSTLNSFQMPLCSDASDQAMKIYIKSEPVSNLYLTTQNTSSNLPQTSKVVISPGNILTQATPKNEGQKFMISTKPINNGRFTSSLNISTNGVPSRPLILPLTNHASTVIGNNEGQSTPSKSSNKPLMGSIGGPKTPIIPAATPFPALGGYPLLEVNQTYDPNNHEWGTATKRKQRMIKNRESACQSRQRRKEYVHTLENRLTDCLEENQNLRTSNQQLRDKVQELENENSRLRKLAILTTSGQRRAACILMLVLFIGFNVHPLTFLADRSISGDDRPIKFDESGNFNTPQNWPVPVKSGFHARQLLSVEEQGAERPGVGGVGEGSRVSSNLKKDSFWMDDLVNNYKKEHMDKILGVLRDTSSISLQRMLRRKLKEELGIRVPMPIPRTRRIAYTPQLSQERKALGNSPVEKLKFDAPSPPPNVKQPTKDHACGQSSHVDKQQNETESLRVSQDLEQWIAREKINKEAVKVKVETKRDSPTINKRKRIAIPPKYAHRRPTKATGVAVYKEKEKKLFQFLDTIGRKNDTIYIISLNQDHILLPSMVKNSLLPTKMSLVFPTAPPNDTFANNPDYQTLIQIDCDVTATDYIQVKRDLLPNNHNSDELKSRKP